MRKFIRQIKRVGACLPVALLAFPVSAAASSGTAGTGSNTNLLGVGIGLLLVIVVAGVPALIEKLSK